MRRGHTVDQLSNEELRLLVQHIDKQQQQQQQQKDGAQADEATATAEKSQQAAAKQQEQKKDHDEEKNEDGEEEKKETKEDRRRRLHARNMRYYRSLESDLVANILVFIYKSQIAISGHDSRMNAGPNTPREIKRMASKAKTDASARSVLFEDWLQSGESWKQSKLLARLRNRSSSARRGMRKWLFYSEMVSRFGSEVAAAIKETKEGDPERSLTEIRKWPECEAGFKLHCPNIHQRVGNHIGQIMLEFL